MNKVEVFIQVGEEVPELDEEYSKIVHEIDDFCTKYQDGD